MCQAGCHNENYFGDCSLCLGYCPIEFKDHVSKNIKLITKENKLKFRKRR